MFVEPLGVQVVRFSQEERPVTFRVLLEQQGIFLEEPDALGQRLALDAARMRRVKDADVMPEGDLAERACPPPEVGILTEWHVELLVESVDGVEGFPAEQQ